MKCNQSFHIGPEECMASAHYPAVIRVNESRLEKRETAHKFF